MKVSVMEPYGFNIKESNHGITFIPFLWLHSGHRVNTDAFFPTLNSLTLSWHGLPSPLEAMDGN